MSCRRSSRFWGLGCPKIFHEIEDSLVGQAQGDGHPRHGGQIRRHSQPDQSDSWGGSLFTYGDIYLRRLADETHELLEPAPFPGCLQPMSLPEKRRNRYLRELPAPRCDLEGKPMLRLKSSTRFKNWWYDYRILWIDPRSYFYFVIFPTPAGGKQPRRPVFVGVVHE